MEAVLDETPREFALPAASVLRPFPLSVLADDSRWLHAVDAVGRHGASPGLTGQTPLGAHSVVYRAGSISLRPRRHGQAALRTQVYTLWARRGWTCPQKRRLYGYCARPYGGLQRLLKKSLLKSEAAPRTQVYARRARRGWTSPPTTSYPCPHCRRLREMIVPQME